MATINEGHDYASELFGVGLLSGEDNPHKSVSAQEFKSTRVQELKMSSTQENKSSRSQEAKNSRKQPNKTSRGQELKTPSRQGNKTSCTNEVKKSRTVTDSEGRTRRPANIMMYDDVKVALDILAVRRRVWVWTLIDQAIQEFLHKEGNEIQ